MGVEAKNTEICTIFFNKCRDLYSKFGGIIYFVLPASVLNGRQHVYFRYFDSFDSFETLRFTPAELRLHFDKLGWRSIVAFHTSKPMHAVHYEMTMRASKQANSHILIHPVIGMAKPGDLHYYSRVHCYEAILKQYPKSLVSLALVPMAMQ